MELPILRPASVLRLCRRLIERDGPSRRRGAPRRPHLEVLEQRVTPSTYTWTAKGDGMSWNDPNNWQHLGSMFTQMPGTPTAYSTVVFPSFSMLPKGSSHTINFNFSYVGFPISTLIEFAL